MKKEFLIGLAIFIFVGIGIALSLQKTPPPTTMEDKPSSSSSASSAAMMAKAYTMADIEPHNTPDNCWFAIEGKVYDVTKFIASGKHGGGPAINEGCGKDATELFNTRPMGSGTPHSEKARSFLPNFYIGDLKK